MSQPYTIEEHKQSAADMFLKALDERKYLDWFFQNADFGPADGDVRSIMEEQYERETGKPVPTDYHYE
jgi:hypothetical protein